MQDNLYSMLSWRNKEAKMKIHIPIFIYLKKEVAVQTRQKKTVF